MERACGFSPWEMQSYSIKRKYKTLLPIVCESCLWTWIKPLVYLAQYYLLWLAVALQNYSLFRLSGIEHGIFCVPCRFLVGAVTGGHCKNGSRLDNYLLHYFYLDNYLLQVLWEFIFIRKFPLPPAISSCMVSSSIIFPQFSQSLEFLGCISGAFLSSMH